MTNIVNDTNFCESPIDVIVTFTPKTPGDHTIELDEVGGSSPVTQVYNVASGEVDSPVSVTITITISNLYCNATDLAGVVYANCDPEQEVPYTLQVLGEEEDCKYAILKGANTGLYPIRTVNIENGGAGYTDGSYTNVPIVQYDINTLNGTGFLLDLTISGGVITAASVANIGNNYTFSDWTTSSPNLGFQPDPTVVGTPSTKARIRGNYNLGDAYSLPLDLTSWSCETNTGQTSLTFDIPGDQIDSSSTNYPRFCFDEESLPSNLEFEDSKDVVENCCCADCKTATVILPDIASGSCTIFYQRYGDRKIYSIDVNTTGTKIYQFQGSNEVVNIFVGNINVGASRLLDSAAAQVVPIIHYYECDGPSLYNGTIDGCDDEGQPAIYDLTIAQCDNAPLDCATATFAYYEDPELTSVIANPAAYSNVVAGKIIYVLVTDDEGKQMLTYLTLDYQSPCPE